MLLLINSFINFSEEFVNVGWGRKETQFHGSLGKEAAKQKSEVNYSMSKNNQPYMFIAI